MTTKQQELAGKYKAQIARYVNLVQKASTDQDAMIASGEDAYDVAEAYRYTMSKAADVYADLELMVTQECCSIPFKASRNKTIDAFMAYVNSLT